VDRMVIAFKVAYKLTLITAKVAYKLNFDMT